MKILCKSLGIISYLTIFSFVTSSINANSYERLPDLKSGDLIYGLDDRIEINQYPDNQFINKSKSVAMRVPKKRLTVDRNNESRILFPFVTLKNTIPNLCEEERFSEQVSLGNCSGFLVNSKTLVTAGHCMLNAKDCTDNKWVFNFTESVTELKSSQVYSCKKIISQRYVYNENEVSDYAVIELDREVLGFTPLETRKIGRVLTYTPLVVIGHPMGLPMKATDGARVSRMNDIERQTTLASYKLRSNYFTTNLDAYGGNSGSPVFNKKTGKVEGILIQGAEDFEYNNEKKCLESKHLSNSRRNSYEKVMRITKVPGI